MKCPNCGAEMKEGSLYCEICGEDIHIVPDFEPELELNLERTINDIVNNISDQTKSTEKEGAVQETNANQSKSSQDWDNQYKSGEKKGIKRYLFKGMAACGIIVLVIAFAAGIAYYRYYSMEYQVTKAEYYTADKQYEEAVSYYNRALELEPDNIELKFALAEVYFLKNNKIEYEYLLRDIVKDKNATTEQLESAYGKLIAIYRAREDYQTINELLLSCENESIIVTYQSYIAVNPEFSVKEGYYNSIQPLKLTTFGTGKIYYTLDGSEPDENSLLYTAPILLESGDYCIKAVYINENGIASDVVTRNYHIEIEMLSSPEVSVVSGDYEFPINISIEGDDEDIYYTKDGSVPTMNSSVYTRPIPMPLGDSVFKFIKIADGKSSEVVERTYSLKMHTEFTPEQAVEVVIEYSLSTEKIFNEIGHFDDTGAAYKYEFQYATNINQVDDFYVISEILRDADMNLSKTGNHFAVNAYTQELFKLQIGENNNYTLVEIEK
ncbi:MAG: chitobiase/beta-hexosaminidase C-terminal domain-containing protein, partial [Lachnospiraceae bacterium]|nr:chitobiase/beta-hexosaminidase C-terminal domain-containing protein [Lachnospiraceae bacterium]